MQVSQTVNSSRPEAVCGPISSQYQGSWGSEVGVYSKQEELGKEQEKIAIWGQDKLNFESVVTKGCHME